MREPAARKGLNRLIGDIMIPNEEAERSRDEYGFPWGPVALAEHGLLGLLRIMLDKAGFHPIGSFVGVEDVMAEKVFRILCDNA